MRSRIQSTPSLEAVWLPLPRVLRDVVDMATIQATSKAGSVPRLREVARVERVKHSSDGRRLQAKSATGKPLLAVVDGELRRIEPRTNQVRVVHGNPSPTGLQGNSGGQAYPLRLNDFAVGPGGRGQAS